MASFIPPWIFIYAQEHTVIKITYKAQNKYRLKYQTSPEGWWVLGQGGVAFDATARFKTALIGHEC